MAMLGVLIHACDIQTPSIARDSANQSVTTWPGTVSSDVPCLFALKAITSAAEALSTANLYTYNLVVLPTVALEKGMRVTNIRMKNDSVTVSFGQGVYTVEHVLPIQTTKRVMFLQANLERLEDGV